MTEEEKHQHLKIKIAVSGAAATDHCGDEALEKATELGKEIVRQEAVLVHGATTGFPLWSGKGAKEEGGTVIGVSPAASEAEHVELYNLPLDYMDLIIYTGSGFNGRNLLLTRATDAVVVGCGRIGTINEFTVAYEDKKPLGVLEGSWATDEVIKFMVEKSNRKNDKLIFDKDPKRLIERLIEMVEAEKKESYGVYANSDKVYKDCNGPDCKVIL
tara:strand:+ start:22616 stop:23260 length:645 start_codon:yes stop_codon:yes gene_type:complete